MTIRQHILRTLGARQLSCPQIAGRLHPRDVAPVLIQMVEEGVVIHERQKSQGCELSEFRLPRTWERKGTN